MATIARIDRACEAVAVPWAVGGSFASGLYGEPRATNDVDVIACLRLGHVKAFVTALGTDVYVDADVIREAIAGCRSFNVLDEQTFVKIDVFVPPPGPLGEGQLQRRRRVDLGEGAHLDHGYLDEVARGAGLLGLLERAKLDAAG